MWRSLFRISAATGLYGGFHTLLASRSTKLMVAQWLGEDVYRGWYRVFFNAQAAVSTAALFWYLLRQPDRELFQARGSFRWLMHGLQLVAVCYGAWAAREVGFARFAGWTNIAAWINKRRRTDEENFIPPRDAQGPSASEEGQLLTGGPFRFSRHPLNLVPLVVFWMKPRITANSLMFNVLVSLYAIAGSWHEEQLLSDIYGEAYEQYRRSGVPFFVPRWWHRNTSNEDDNSTEASSEQEI